MKRVFGMVEVVFDILYLLIAFSIGIGLLLKGENQLAVSAGVMSILLAAGDSFHLVPRILTILKNDPQRYEHALGAGKLITSITMTIFYLFLYQIGSRLYQIENPTFWQLLVVLSVVRILLCLLPQNKWFERFPPVKWGIIRNIPFFILGMLVSGFFFLNRHSVPAFHGMWLAIFLSFLFYLPVVLWVNKNPKIGMLMLPKSCVYLWMLFMCIALL